MSDPYPYLEVMKLKKNTQTPPIVGTAFPIDAEKTAHYMLFIAWPKETTPESRP